MLQTLLLLCDGIQPGRQEGIRAFERHDCQDLPLTKTAAYLTDWGESTQ